MPTTRWYHEGLMFTCTQCGNCCTGTPGYVWTTVAERRRIAEFLDMDLEAFTARYAHRVGMKFSLNEVQDGANYDCVFLKLKDGKRICTVYPVRPQQCRTWPFWSENLKTPDDWDLAAEDCPGMNHGAHHDFVQIEINRKKFF